MRPYRAAAVLVFATLLSAPARAGDMPGFDLPDNLDGLIDPDALDGMMQEMMRDFGPVLEEMLRGAGDLMDELDAYEPPEMLPNGDIIIRRRRPPGGPVLPPPVPGPLPEEGPVWL